MNESTKSILIGCYEIPGFGGASTATYKLFEMMQADGVEVRLFNLIHPQDVPFFRYAYGEDYGNPRRLAQVANCLLDHPPSPGDAALAKMIREAGPGLMLGVGYIAARLMKNAAPEIPLAFLTTGSFQAEQLIARGTAKDAASLLRFLQRAVNVRQRFQERQMTEIIEKADLILTHSPLTKSLFECFFPYHTEKFYEHIVWFAEWIYEDARQYAHLQLPFPERNIDLLFLASSWKRPEKNFAFVEKIVKQFKHCSIHLAGEYTRRLPNAVFHGLVADRDELFRLMGRSKTVVCPSLIDAAPGILFEASAMGCNIVTSRNCGNWQLCHPQLLVHPFTARNFIEKTALSLERKFEDNIAYFLAKNTYRDLVETLLVL